MGYREFIQGSVRLAFSTIGDIPESVDYVSSNVPSYDAADGEVRNAEKTYTVNGVFTSYGALFSRDPTLAKEDFTGDLAMYVLKGDLTGELPFEPRNNDYIVRNGDRLSISGIRSDPTNVLYTLLLKRP